ncbi:flagellar protein FliS [Pacificimonas sp. WHA3]|uniref:Flagellar secretion chaperone FliS n=1 Tax=Pacificimonas pallii TaxID=2827236 RepID=A0ABS6SF05_9SPHN|nr:flagellar export chaperone FliS [Pacificimonas pallii]MBV7256988.1 flagellar protein FliS [Pacificimonas pallii]
MQTRIKAHNQYASVAASTRAEGADPHRLVALLFEECLTCLKRVELSLMNDAGDLAGTAASKARAILDALSGSLDFEQGGRIADDLAAIYDYCKNRLTHAVTTRDGNAAREAHGILAEIASGWAAIGQSK